MQPQLKLHSFNPAPWMKQEHLLLFVLNSSPTFRIKRLRQIRKSCSNTDWSDLGTTTRIKSSLPLKWRAYQSVFNLTYVSNFTHTFFSFTEFPTSICWHGTQREHCSHACFPRIDLQYVSKVQVHRIWQLIFKTGYDSSMFLTYTKPILTQRFFWNSKIRPCSQGQRVVITVRWPPCYSSPSRSVSSASTYRGI